MGKPQISHVLVLVFAIIVAQHRWTFRPPTFGNVEFDFHVFCPMFYEKSIPDSAKAALPYINTSYVITVRDDYIVHEDGLKNHSFFYCGLARAWNGNCQNAEYVCSTPGPAFDLVVNERIYVVWRNQIKGVDTNFIFVPNFFAADMAICYNRTTEHKPQRCFQMQKKKEHEDHTYFDPTDIRDNFNTLEKGQITVDSVPISPHIHGLSVRPAYDGNPLAWFSNSGVGAGFFSAEQEYFQRVEKNLTKLINSIYRIDGNRGFRSKFNVYENNQHPGPVFYHDHAMGSTGFNMNKGLVGMYLLRSKEEERMNLPSREYEKILLISHYSYKDRPEKFKVFASDSIQELKKNATYRFRFLNTDFQEHFNKLVFLYNCPKESLKTCPNQINFTVIGADSSLRKYPTQEKQFRLSTAERVDILIRFPDLPEPYVVDVYDREKGQVMAFMKIIGYETKQKEGYEIPTQLPVTFVDLKEIDTTNMKKRMRPLMYFDGTEENRIDWKFSINGHISYHHGKTDKPIIGTTEDWYFINFNEFGGHPMHFHLVNFQLTQQYLMRLVDDKVSYYQCDFFLKYADFSNKECSAGNSLYSQLQAKWKSGIPLTNEEYLRIAEYTHNLLAERAEFCFDDFSNEQDFDENNISGINLLQKCEDGSECNKASSQNCSAKQYKYICDNTTSELYEFEKGWKDTAFVKTSSALVIRVRWAKSQYVEGSWQPFFNEKEEDLIEFPGYSYHCHFQTHEDNEMMRPFMLQPSGREKVKHWEERYKQLQKEEVRRCDRRRYRKGLRKRY